MSKGLSYNDLYKKCEYYQLEADYAAGKFVYLREKYGLWAALQEYCDFNTFYLFEYMDWYKEFQMFLFYHGDELKRKLTFDEFLYYGMRYRIVCNLREPKDFEDFKKIKIKKAFI